MRMKITMGRCLGVGVLLAPLMAGAVVISGGDGLGNTNAPVDDPGWANVGQFNSGQNSAVYLGNGWVLTAYHVKANDNPTQVKFAGTWYGLDTNSWTRITNSTGTGADMILVRTTTTPPLADVTLRSTQIPNGADLVMIGNGRQRYPTNSYWNSSWQETNEAGAVYTGFGMTAGYLAQRWGANTINNSEKSYNLDDSFGITTSFSTTFNQGVSDNEAQSWIGDSGGAVFYKSGSTWQLVGMMYTLSVLSGQPYPTTAVYGDKSWSANLTTSVYYDQIAAVIPEPGAVALAVAAAGLLGILRRIRRRIDANSGTGGG